MSINDNSSMEIKDKYESMFTEDLDSIGELLDGLGDNNDPKKNNAVIYVDPNRIKDFHDHPFKLYSEDKLEDLVQNIKENGIYTPVLLRPLMDDPSYDYEMLAGHNRKYAAIRAGVNVPAIIKDVSDAEAKNIVVDTNLRQRSPTEMLPSELALAIKMQYEAMKELNRSSKLDSISYEDLSSSEEERHKSRLLLADKFEINPNKLYRYLRLSELNKSLLAKIDEGIIPLIAGVSISYLDSAWQSKISDCIDDNSKQKLTTKKGELLKAHFDNKTLTDEILIQILSDELIDKKKPTSRNVTIKGKVVNDFFPNDTKKEAEKKIIQSIKLQNEVVQLLGDLDEDLPIEEIVVAALRTYLDGNSIGAKDE